jgi:peptide/nickel transport system substrate-binding protein
MIVTQGTSAAQAAKRVTSTIPWVASEVMSPAVHFGLSGAGPNAWFGWPDVPQLEKLTTDWVRATDEARRTQLAVEIQRLALREVAYVPWGEWVQPSAVGKNVHGVLKFILPLSGMSGSRRDPVIREP